jgi:hypothetical protein
MNTNNNIVNNNNLKINFDICKLFLFYITMKIHSYSQLYNVQLLISSLYTNKLIKKCLKYISIEIYYSKNRF